MSTATILTTTVHQTATIRRPFSFPGIEASWRNGLEFPGTTRRSLFDGLTDRW
jgi:hypothetical protein